VDVGESRHLNHWLDVPQYYNTPFGYAAGTAVSTSSGTGLNANVAIISYLSRHLQAPAHGYAELLAPRHLPSGRSSDPDGWRWGPGLGDQLSGQIPVCRGLQRVPDPERSGLAAVRELKKLEITRRSLGLDATVALVTPHWPGIFDIL